MARTSILLLALFVGATAAYNSEDPNSCQACRGAVSFAREFNSSSHRAEYTDLFKGFCEQYYPPSNDFQQGPCNLFVQALFFVMDRVDPVTHCDRIGACGGLVQPSDDLIDYLENSNRAEPGPQDKVICTFCKNLVNEIKKTLSDDANLELIKSKTGELCDYLRTIGEDQKCADILGGFKNQIKFLLSVLDESFCYSPLEVCVRRPVRAKPAQRLLPTLADFNNFGIETAVTIGAKPTKANSDQLMKGPECALCKTVVKEMFHFLRENKTEANIIDGLDRICKLVYPAQPKQDQCQSMVKAYTRELVQLLVDETDPEVICMLLEQCTYSKVPESHEISRVNATSTPTSNANDLAHLITALDSSVGYKSLRACFECKIFIKYLKDRLDNPQSQDELKQWLLANLCKELPEKELVQSCSAMVEEYSAIFFKAVVGELNPQTACVELGVCNPKTIVHVLNIGGSSPKNSISRLSPAIQRVVVSKETRCSRCTEVVSNLDTYLATHRYGDDTWSKVCENSKAEKRADYMDILNQHGADIVQMIPNMESPRHLCQQIAIC